MCITWTKSDIHLYPILHQEIDNGVSLKTKFKNRTNDFNLPIVNFLFLYETSKQRQHIRYTSTYEALYLLSYDTKNPVISITLYVFINTDQFIVVAIIWLFKDGKRMISIVKSQVGDVTYTSWIEIVS